MPNQAASFFPDFCDDSLLVSCGDAVFRDASALERSCPVGFAASSLEGGDSLLVSRWEVVSRDTSGFERSSPIAFGASSFEGRSGAFLADGDGALSFAGSP